MASELHPHQPDSLSARADQPLIGIPVEVDGQQQVRYFADEAAADAARLPSVTQDALGVIGAWSDLDWDEMVEELDRIRHASPPTPPIDAGLRRESRQHDDDSTVEP